MMIVNKGMRVWSYEQLKVSKTALGFTLIIVLHSIEDRYIFNENLL